VANEYLGREYELNGIIIKGQQLGRSIGFPTANIHITHDYKLIPCDGAYAVIAQIEGNNFKGMLNIGMRPTVNGSSQTIEVHLFDFEGDLYDMRVCVKLKSYLRPEIKFSGLEALQLQLKKDKEEAIGILNSY
jgi:riboflavin kinase / FMN adenylyltransferase